METKYKTHRIPEVVLLFICLVVFPVKKSHADEDSKYLKAVREFADNVLKYGRDTYGPKHTPLFVDGLNIHTHEPVKWISPEGERWILSNLASQQNLFRTLDGLTKITGDPKYRQAAVEAIKYAFENLRSPNGLLYWGIGAAYDAQRERVSSPYEYTSILAAHSLKWHFPFYELMWEVNPSVTKQLIESLWSAHILDWSNLDMDRGSIFDSSLQKPWEYEYKPGPVPFHSKLPWGQAFISAGANLSHAAAILHKLSGDREPLIWSKRLMHRYVETRDPNTGISASPYTQSKINRARYQFGDDFQGHIMFDGTFFPQDYLGWSNPMIRGLVVGELNITPGVPYSIVVGLWTSQLLLGDSLGANGQEFTQWALEELTALGKVAYRREDNSFIPMLTDGISLEGYVCKKDGYYGSKGTAFEPIRAVPMDFWAYVLAYRITEDRFMWEMARNIALGQGFGDIGISPTNKPELQKEALSSDPFTLLSFLELYKKTGNKAFLEAARKIGDNILANRVHKVFFLASSRHIYAKFDVFEPLALLHLHAAIKAGDKSVPTVWPNKSSYSGPYRYRFYETDYEVIYALTESPEPPMSLEEVVAIGDVGEVKRLISQGVDVDERTDGYHKTPLQTAATKGHRNIVELLLVEGADVNAASGGGPVGFTALHYAAEKGYKEIAELLIAKGADVNAKNADGGTSLHLVTRAGHKDIVELLITKGADVNIKNKDGQTPLDIAVNQDYSEIVKMLISKGADVSLDVAARFGALAKVKNLIEKGADVNAKNTAGQTPLHYAARSGHKEIVELLLAHGADVNIGAHYNLTAADLAMQRNHNEVVELLVSKGADISPLHIALYMKDQVKAKSLIESGADVNKRTPYGTTPLDRAVNVGFKDIAELLIAKGANINAKDNWDWTPLHSAAAKGHRELATLLIAKGANVNAIEGGGRTPLWYAEKEGHTEIVKLLRKHGAKE